MKEINPELWLLDTPLSAAYCIAQVSERSDLDNSFQDFRWTYKSNQIENSADIVVIDNKTSINRWRGTFIDMIVFKIALNTRGIAQIQDHLKSPNATDVGTSIKSITLIAPFINKVNSSIQFFLA